MTPLSSAFRFERWFDIIDLTVVLHRLETVVGVMGTSLPIEPFQLLYKMSVPLLLILTVVYLQAPVVALCCSQFTSSKSTGTLGVGLAALNSSDWSTFSFFSHHF